MKAISADPDKPYESGSEGVGIKPNIATTARASGQPFAVRRYGKTTASDMYGATGASPGAQRPAKVPTLRRSKVQQPKPDDL